MPRRALGNPVAVRVENILLDLVEKDLHGTSATSASQLGCSLAHDFIRLPTAAGRSLALQRGGLPNRVLRRFRVRKIADDIIFVSREKRKVDVISLKAIDPDLNKHVKVKLLESNNVLCGDLSVDCITGNATGKAGFDARLT